MSVVQIVFILMSVVVLGSALGVVVNKNLFRSALFLVLAFVGVAGLYILLEAGFLAAIQILVYAGAIAVLIIFAIMLTRGLMSDAERQVIEDWRLVAIPVVILLVGMVLVIVRGEAFWTVTDASPPADIVAQLGESLMGAYVLPFEVASVLLLAALVGAVTIARER